MFILHHDSIPGPPIQVVVDLRQVISIIIIAFKKGLEIQTYHYIFIISISRACAQLHILSDEAIAYGASCAASGVLF